MPTVRDVAEPLAEICVPVPAAGDGICIRCHNHPTPGYRRCYSCDNVEGQVSRPAKLVVPVSLYEIPSQLHHLLRRYKDGDVAQRRDFPVKVIAVLCHFLERHGDCIANAAGVPWDVITSVPSSGNRAGEHPLVRALRLVPSTFGQYERLLVRTDVNIDHNRAADEGYRPARRLHGERVLLIDDTFTSGARAQSAASALALGGAEVVAIVPVGRVIDPSYAPTRAWWDDHSRLPFDFGVCCLE